MCTILFIVHVLGCKKVSTKFKNFTNQFMMILDELPTNNVVNEYFEFHEQVCEQVYNSLCVKRTSIDVLPSKNQTLCKYCTHM